MHHVSWLLKIYDEHPLYIVYMYGKIKIMTITSSDVLILALEYGIGLLSTHYVKTGQKTGQNKARLKGVRDVIQIREYVCVLAEVQF